MATVTQDAIWEKINEDAEFIQQPESVRAAIRPYIDALPIILTDLLEKPVTLESLMQAKIVFLRYCIDNGYIKAAVDAMPDEALGFFSRDALPAMFESMLSKAIDIAESMFTNIPALMKQIGSTEKQFMLGPNVGFNAEACSLYNADQLTIGELLIVQPMVIVKNTK